MNKVFSHKVTLQIMSVILVILLANSFIQNRNLNKYVHERVDKDLSQAIDELEQMNEAIFGLYMGAAFEEDHKIDTEHIFNLGLFQEEIEKIFKLSQGPFRWYDLDRVEWNINDINKKGYLSKEDEKYLKSFHNYNKRLIQAYHEILNKNKIDENSFDIEHKKIKKVYKAFMEDANRMAMEEEYRRIRRYRVYKEEGKTMRNNEKAKTSISLKEANELGVKVLERLFHEEALLTKEKDSETDEYTFSNKWEDGKDKNLYSISIDKEKGSFSMYKRSQLVTNTLSEEEIDKKAREIKDIVVPKNYVCYERKKRLNEGKLEEIEYKFIEKINSVYNEFHIIEMQINCYGALSDLYISDPLNEKMLIEKPKLTKEDILSKLSKGKIENILLVKDKKGQLEYRVFIDFNEDIYTYIFDGNTGEKRDFRKSEKMYFKRVDNM